MSGALGRIVGTTLALWLPLVPLYLFVRHAIQSRTPSRRVPQLPTAIHSACYALQKENCARMLSCIGCFACFWGFQMAMHVMSVSLQPVACAAGCCTLPVKISDKDGITVLLNFLYFKTLFCLPS